MAKKKEPAPERKDEPVDERIPYEEAEDQEDDSGLESFEEDDPPEDDEDDYDAEDENYDPEDFSGEDDL